MMPVECNVRVFEEIERLLGEQTLITPQAVIDELEKLSVGAGTEATAASVGLDLAQERCQVYETDAEYADDAILELAEKATHVCTNDGPLQERLLEAGVSVISLRGQNKLAITQP